MGELITRRKVTNPHAAIVTNPHCKLYGGQALSMGEIFMLKGLRSDENLLKHGFVRPMPEGDEAIICSFDNRAFAHESGYSTHMRDQHQNGGRESGALESESPPLPAEDELTPPSGTRLNMAQTSMGVGVSTEE